VLQAYQKLCGGWILAAGLVSLATAACSSGAGDGSGATNDSGSSGTASGASTGASGSTTGAGGATGTTTGASGATSGTPIEDGGVDSTIVDSGSGPPGQNCIWTFDDPDAGTQGWVFNPYRTGADPYIDADNGVDPSNLSEQTAITWDNAGGNPEPPAGEMTVTIPFDAYTPPYGQHVDIYTGVPGVPLPAAVVDLSQSVITMQVKLDPAADGGVPFSPSATAPGGLVMYIKTGMGYVYAQNTYTNITSTDHNWVQYSFDVKNGINTASSPNLDAGFDPTHVVQIGFTLNTGSGGLPLADGAPPNTAPPTPATFHIDSICLVPSQ
jgi:hypothetical protein